MRGISIQSNPQETQHALFNTFTDTVHLKTLPGLHQQQNHQLGTISPSHLRDNVKKETNCLVWWVVCLKLLVVGELDVDGLASKDWSDCGVVVYHGVGCLLCIHFYESLHRKSNQSIQHISKAAHTSRHECLSVACDWWIQRELLAEMNSV